MTFKTLEELSEKVKLVEGNAIFLNERIEISKELDEDNFKKFGEITKLMHSVSFEEAVKFDKKNYDWKKYLEAWIKKSVDKSFDKEMYGLLEGNINDIAYYLEEGLIYSDYSNFTLVHGSYHFETLSSQDEGLIITEKNPDFLSGDPKLDVASVVLDMAIGTIIENKDKDGNLNKECLKAFWKGYGENLIEDTTVKAYITLLAFDGLDTDQADKYKDVLDTLVGGIHLDESLKKYL